MLGPALELRWFPLTGMSDPRQEASGLAAWLDVAWHAVLPVSALALQQTAFFITVAHAKARVELEQGYVRAARARGIAERTIVWRHVGRNIGPQIATAALNRVGMLFTGAVLIETLFAWPGLGRLLSTAILNRDHPVLLGVFALVVAAVLASSLLADIVQARLDPRIEFDRAPQ
jgi:peptide/nickel transport system permease protein